MVTEKVLKITNLETHNLIQQGLVDDNIVDHTWTINLMASQFTFFISRSSTI